MAEQGPGRRRTTLPAAQRESQLLEVARNLLLADGPTELTVDKVTAAAQVAKGTFYLYFNSKDHLLARLWADYLDAFLAIVHKQLDVATPAAGWPGAIDELIEQMIRYDMANAVLHRAVFSQASGDGLRQLRQADSKVITLIAEAVASAVAAGSASVTDPPTTAALMYYAVDGLLNAAYLANTEPDADSLIAAAKEMVHRTLGTARA
ncbi:TetR/AcrR family transcriptional regulator [Mycolicibacter longobardus]|uniref:TetR family transcriptional regulator n=1 Tax=Mycolicibacter longobardus TaxID=1108812 RepID=A0A1X1YN40_9MYCO|nr:TetR/AcrR family transcriptional regulator [Mycolicibacter longobardus]MCV7385092.1 TetR/AcrR family transcriptional regulator [Mycolicibacter longobardus]ORW12536.1 TetR family transcriptional regulator [Mycolicibacter longobardus]